MWARHILLSVATLAALALPAAGQDAPAAARAPAAGFNKQIDFRRMTSAEQTAARKEARRRRFDKLVFCADPGNMPLSNNKGEGLQNRIAEAVGRQMGAKVQFFWRPFLERGLTRETFDNKECEILIEVPFGFERILTSRPIYRSTYVFATRSDAGFAIDGMDDPDLRTKRIGVFQHSGMREALSRRGIKDVDVHVLSYDADLEPEKQPWTQVQKVVDGTLDIAGVWGPFAGWVKAQGAPLTLTPANVMEDDVVLEFSMAFGVRTNDVVMKYALDFALEDARDEIAAILRDYGVPLVQCPDCIVSGDLPSHGTYFGGFVERSQDRFLTPVPDKDRSLDMALATPDQVMTIERVDRALARGASVQDEFDNAVLASDETRARYLAGKGADLDRRDRQGVPPLVTAARNRDLEMIGLLLDLGAGVNDADSSGNTALHNAVLRNHVPTVKLLAERGADLTAPGYDGVTPLALAISEDMRWAAQALIEAGAPAGEPFGPEELTPLMLLATQDENATRMDRVSGGPSLVELAQMLVDRGADPNATTSHGVTALMIAAGGDQNDMLAFLLKAGADPARANSDGRTALDVADVAGSVRAAQALRVLAP